MQTKRGMRANTSLFSEIITSQRYRLISNKKIYFYAELINYELRRIELVVLISKFVNRKS